ncbi:hypothetical protein JHFBIEKO_4624 [Methylobacterium mesophilicum]|nr:hypothetical protein JHFBIEKO_4624 [Methylobacterium mesophilicum]
MPVSDWVRVKVLAGSAMSSPPPPAAQAIGRSVAVKPVPVTCRTPPSKLSGAEAAPRLASRDTDKVPPAKVVPPE